MTRDYCRKHAQTNDHKTVCEAKICKPNFEQSVSNSFKKEEQSVCAAMKNVYYMAKSNHPNSELSDLIFCV